MVLITSKLRIGIVCGGCSSEHEISLKSATYIAKVIDKNQFEIVILWIHKNGSWYVIHDKYHDFFSSLNQYKCIPIVFRQFSGKFYFCFNKHNNDNILELDVIFPIVHGTLGEDGSLQGFLNIMNIPYVGSDVLGSSLCMHKDITRNVLRDFGLPIIPFKTFFKHDLKKINFRNLADIFGVPFFVKPVNQGSSIGVSWVDTRNCFNQALDLAFSYSEKIIIEPFIEGKELECAILGGNNVVESSICGEISIKNNHFYTYIDKYIQHDSDIIIPALINDTISNKIRCISVQAFRALNCFGMARIDLFLAKNNQIFINEVNTLPGFTNNSMYPKLWEKTGLIPQVLITKLIKLALDRS